MFAIEDYIITYIVVHSVVYEHLIHSGNIDVKMMCFTSILPYYISVLASCYQAVETLKTFEKKDTRAKSTAGTNLSFLYFLVGSSHQIRRHLTCLSSAVREPTFNAPV